MAACCAARPGSWRVGRRPAADAKGDRWGLAELLSVGQSLAAAPVGSRSAAKASCASAPSDPSSPFLSVHFISAQQAPGTCTCRLGHARKDLVAGKLGKCCVLVFLERHTAHVVL